MRGEVAEDRADGRDEPDPHHLRNLARHELETAVLAGESPFARRGAAQAELIRRDREYAEEQARLERQFRMDMFNAESDREAKRKTFDRELAEQQMAHVTDLALQQLGAAQSAAKAARLAAWATALAAIGAVAQAMIAALK